MTTISYNYATGDLIESPNTYFYTAFHGAGFMSVWKDSRMKIRNELPEAIPPLKASFADPASSATRDLQERALAGDSQLMENFIAKFEITKRVHESYNDKFLAVDREKRHDLSLYLRSADLFAFALTHPPLSRNLNVYLKCVDTLCAMLVKLDVHQKGRLAWHIDNELSAIEELASSLGLELGT
jgi:methionyl-tRNA formyltransferase